MGNDYRSNYVEREPETPLIDPAIPVGNMGGPTPQVWNKEALAAEQLKKNAPELLRRGEGFIDAFSGAAYRPNPGVPLEHVDKRAAPIDPKVVAAEKAAAERQGFRNNLVDALARAGAYNQTRNDAEMHKALQQSDRVAGLNAAMMKVLTSRGVSPALAKDLMTLHGHNVSTGNADSDRSQKLFDRTLQNKQSGTENVFDNLAKIYQADALTGAQNAEAAAAQSAAAQDMLVKMYGLQNDQAKMVIDAITNGGDMFQPGTDAGDNRTAAIIRAIQTGEMLPNLQSFFKPQEKRDGGVVGYADGGQVDPMADALGAAMADPVAEGAPAAMESGDYVIPADVLRFYGLKFFQGMIQKAEEAELG